MRDRTIVGFLWVLFLACLFLACLFLACILAGAMTLYGCQQGSVAAPETRPAPRPVAACIPAGGWCGYASAECCVGTVCRRIDRGGGRYDYRCRR